MANLRRRISQPTESLFAENHEPFFNNIDPQRRFAAVKCRIAKGSFDHFVSDSEQ